MNIIDGMMDYMGEEVHTISRPAILIHPKYLLRLMRYQLAILFILMILSRVNRLKEPKMQKVT